MPGVTQCRSPPRQPGISCCWLCPEIRLDRSISDECTVEERHSLSNLVLCRKLEHAGAILDNFRPFAIPGLFAEFHEIITRATFRQTSNPRRPLFVHLPPVTLSAALSLRAAIT